LFDIKNVAFTRILMDQGIYVSMLVFAAGLRHLIPSGPRAESEWIGTLLFGCSVGMGGGDRGRRRPRGGAVSRDVERQPPTRRRCRRSLPERCVIYNGSIALAITGFFLAAAAWATFDSGVLPRWTGWIAVAGACCRRLGACDVWRSSQLCGLL
jgi:hypothetical protein